MCGLYSQKEYRKCQKEQFGITSIIPTSQIQ